MSWITDIHWVNVLKPDTSPIEIFVRGTIIYLALFLLLRVVLKRQSSGLAMADLLVIVLIADAAQNGMAGDYTSVPDGVILVAVLVFWAWVIDFVGFHVPWIERFVKPPKLPLVENGRIRRDNMRRELVTREELDTKLRENGLDDLSRVRAAYMEPDGEISVLTYDNK
jgi:uncharacterized membrane protein YcaP (DUF421 family)